MKMSPAQALEYAITGARNPFQFLKELEVERQKAVQGQKDGALVKIRQQIIADAFVTYLTSLFDSRKGTHSLVNSYIKHRFIEEFKNNEVVKKCIKHRHNRAGHQSQGYGFFVSINDILSSDLESWLNDAYFAVCTKSIPQISDPK